MNTFNKYLELVVAHYNISDKDRLYAAILVCKHKDHLTVQEALQMQESGLPIMKTISEVDNIEVLSIIDKIESREICYSYGDFVTLIWHLGCRIDHTLKYGLEFDEWIDINERLPTCNVIVNVRLKDGRFTNSFILSTGGWAFNIAPTHWSVVHG